jgi:NAD(P)H-dependent flavin oxidoreductase YrpB (nitropropane dioxygenase family)
MGPFPVTELCIASANAGVLGMLSTAGAASKDTQRTVYEHFCDAAGASYDDDFVTIYKKMIKKVYFAVKDSGGVFGVNSMVAVESAFYNGAIFQAIKEVLEEYPDCRNNLRCVVTSAGDPLPWTKLIKEDLKLVWGHVLPSVKAAKRCKKAGVDILIASGHEGGFHTSWRPVHSLILTPDVVEKAADENTIVCGCGGYCDAKTLAAAFAMGAEGVQMGTRFLATEESDFAQLWKDMVVEAGDGDTLIARGFVGPARWLRMPKTEEHAVNTLQKAPGTFLGFPDDLTTIDNSLIDFERDGLEATAQGDRENAMAAAGESSQRIDDLPKVADMVEQIMAETEVIIKELAGKYLV